MHPRHVHKFKMSIPASLSRLCLHPCQIKTSHWSDKVQAWPTPLIEDEGLIQNSHQIASAETVKIVGKLVHED